MANYATLKIKQMDELFLVCSGMSTNVCFWFIAQSIVEVLNQGLITLQIRQKLKEHDGILLSVQSINDGPEFFRLPINSPMINREFIDNLLNKIVKYGKECQF